MDSPVLPLELQQWLAYGVMTGFSDEAILAQTADLPAETVSKCLSRLRESPLSQVGSQFARQVVDLQWLLQLQTDLQQTSPYFGLPTLVGAQIEEIRRDYLFANRPVRILGLLDDWPARQWTPDYLRRRWGHQPLEFTERVEASGSRETRKRQSTLADFLDLIEQPQGRGRYYWTAYNQLDPSPLLAELAEGVGAVTGLTVPAQDGRIFYWIGPEGTRSGLHFDPYNVLFAQLKGSKRFYLLPPSAMPALSLANDFFSPIDLEYPDPQSYPRAVGLRPIQVDIQEGEVLLLPVGWFHQVTSLSYSVSISLTNLDLPNGNQYQAPSAFRGIL